MKIVASIQARLSSSRLPGKVMKEICGKPMLQWQVDRIKQSRLVDQVIIATTLNPVDDIIYSFCKDNDICCFRGSEDDVLQRITDLIRENNVDIHVECFGDSPLTDPRMIDEFVGYLLKYYDSLDFVSNSLKTTYPPGTEILVYKSQALIDANDLVPVDDPLREHVSLNIYSRPAVFSVKNLVAPKHLNYPKLFMEVDTSEDFAVMTFIIEEMERAEEKAFTIEQVIRLLQANPDIASLNRAIERRWKEFRSDV